MEKEKNKLFKRWDEYNDEERKQLPPLPSWADEVSDEDYVPFIWDGKRWLYIWRD